MLIVTDDFQIIIENRKVVVKPVVMGRKIYVDTDGWGALVELKVQASGKFLEWATEAQKSRDPHFNTVAPVELKHGLFMSVQASNRHQCSPSSNALPLGSYDSYEVARVSKKIDALDPYITEESEHVGTIYGHVPANVLNVIFDGWGGAKDA